MNSTNNQSFIVKPINTLDKLEITYVSPQSDLFPNDYNPNKQDKKEFELLKKSILEDGFTQPIVVNRIGESDKGIIVDGEHRWKAALELGLESIPVVFVNMSRVQAQIATLRHNRARGEEDPHLLKDLFEDLARVNAFDWISDSLLMDKDEWDSLLDGLGDKGFGCLDKKLSDGANEGGSNEAVNRGIGKESADDDNSKDTRTNQDVGTDNKQIDKIQPEIDSVNGGGSSETIDYTESTGNVKSSYADANGNEIDLTESTVSTEENTQRHQQTSQTYTKGGNRDDRNDSSGKTIQNNNTYHINLLFTGEEADLVSVILGTDPSKKIVELCLRESNKNDIR